MEPDWRARAASLPSPDTTTWRPVVHLGDDPALDTLVRSGAVREVHDTLLDQLGDLVEARAPRRRFDAAEREAAVRAHLGDTPPWRYGRWVHYPWSGRLVHLLPPDEHHALRTDRNRYKITEAEQATLRGATIGVVGLSVGQAAAITLALEGVGGRLRLADFDALALSNLNRLRAGVHEVGIPKCVIAARAVAELDPYLPVEILPAGVDDDNLAAFLDGLDLLVEECDDLRMKLRLREEARARGIPVLMDTSDRGLLDVERFDREPDRPVLHGLVGDLRADGLRSMSAKAKVPIVLRILGEETLSPRLAASLPEVRETVSTWPQLASAVALGGALVADTARRVLLGEMTASGRFWVDLESLVRDGAGAFAEAVATADTVEPAPEACIIAVPTPPAPIARGVATARALVASAVLAPSGHNIQPWRFRWRDGALTGAVDVTRRLPGLDFRDLGAWAALGAAALNVELAARAAGLEPSVELGPSPDDPHRAFRVRLGSGPADIDPLHAWIGRRVTNRRLGVRVPLAGAREPLLAEAAAEGCALVLVEAPDALDALGDAIGAGDRLSWLHEPLHRDIVSGFRWTRAEVEAHRDGLDVATLELAAGDVAAMKVVTRWERASILARLGLGRVLEDGARDAVRASSAVGLLLAPGDGPLAWLRGGRALQRVWLRAAALDLALHPVATLPALFARRRAGEIAPEIAERVAAIEAGFRAAIPRREGWSEVLLFRLGRAPPPTARSLRRPVDAVLSERDRDD